MRAKRLASAPRLVIKRDTPRSARLFALLMLTALVAAIAAGSFELGRRFSMQPGQPARDAAPAQPAALQQAAVPAEAGEAVPGAESQLTMLRSAQEQLAEQVKALELENTRLKEDLAFFENFLPATRGSEGVAIQNLTAETVAPNQVRYRMLVVRDALQKNDFSGEFELKVGLLLSGKPVTMTFPEKGAANSEKFGLKFKYYQRVDGMLTLPENATIKTVQARVLEKNKVKAQQSVDL